MPTYPFQTMPFLNIEGEGREFQTYKPGRIICRQGDKARHVFFLRSGQVKVAVRNGEREALIGIVRPGGFFGDLSLEYGRSLATCTAMVTCDVTRLARTEMLNEVHTNPKFAKAYVAYLAERGGQLFHQLTNQLFHSVDERLALTLLALSDNGRTVIGPEINQRVLAEMVGTQRPRINYFMKRFRKHGCVEYSADGIITVNAPALIEMLSRRESGGK